MSYDSASGVRTAYFSAGFVSTGFGSVDFAGNFIPSPSSPSNSFGGYGICGNSFLKAGIVLAAAEKLASPIFA